MEIMGGLIILDREDTLPIPWYMRGHLGLQTGCKVSYAPTDSGKRTGQQLPDIVVSPLDPRQLHEITTVTLANKEGIGTLAEVIGEIEPPINIALADSVTIEGRARHRINLVVEKADGAESDKYVDRRSSFLRRFSKAPDTYDYHLEFSQIYRSQGRFKWSKSVRVRNACIRIGDLLHQIRRQNPGLVDEYDLGKVVVSSNPDQRILRYIIPRKGVITIEIPHEDFPGALRTIVKGVGAAGYNILCSRLSRVPPDDSVEKASVFVAECEPGENALSPTELIESLAPDSGYVGKFHYGNRARDILYPRPRHAIVALPQASYQERIKKQLDDLRVANPAYRGDRRRCVFVSRRFIETKPNIDEGVRSRYKKVLGALERGIEQAGWVMASAPPNHAGKSIEDEIYPRLWVSDAIIVVAFFDDGSGEISVNQAHELGFYMGQNKDTAILIDNAKKDDLKTLSNYAGRQILDYHGNAAFDDSDPGSISVRVKDWLAKVARDL